LLKLVETMEKVSHFVDAIQSNVTEKVKILEDTIRRIFVQTIECSIFIQSTLSRVALQVRKPNMKMKTC
jgi:hypothetical protein